MVAVRFDDCEGIQVEHKRTVPGCGIVLCLEGIFGRKVMLTGLYVSPPGSVQGSVLIQQEREAALALVEETALAAVSDPYTGQMLVGDLNAWVGGGEVQYL